MTERFLSDAPEAIRQTVAALRRLSEKTGPVRLMEVCGTHTVSIFRSGIRSLLPPEIELLSGPGCPVCVTDQSDIDQAIGVCSMKNAAVCTYGDMLRVPGRGTSLREAALSGGDVRVVLSPTDVLELARRDRAREFVFFAVGFETTTPQTSLLLKEAERQKLGNISVLARHKRVLPALELLAQDEDINVKGFLLPGHVSTIIGTAPYAILARKYRRACAVGGFEGQEILLALAALMLQIAQDCPRVVNAYPRGVRDGGNPAARALIDECFIPCSSAWRGLGLIPESGLKLRKEFEHRDAELKLGLTSVPSVPVAGCRCGDVLRGRIRPNECPLFGTVCTPQSPTGPCMVSSEGSCGAWYRWGGLGGKL